MKKVKKVRNNKLALKGHATLDVIGIFCPIADVINAAWYLLDGEAGEGTKCLVYSATGMNIYGTLTKLTTKGSKAYKAAATVEDIIAHGAHAGTITFVSYDTGQLGADLIDKYWTAVEK